MVGIRQGKDNLLRPLGAFERLYHLLQKNNPMSFSVVAEVNRRLAGEELRDALGKVQRRHPLLSAYVEDREPGGPAYRSTGNPIDVTVVDGPAAWDQIVGADITRRFDYRKAPLVRATLIRDDSMSIIVLTFEHTISDGVSSVGILRDLLFALNGGTLERRPVPPPQEELLARMTVIPAGNVVMDERMGRPGLLRTFDGSRPDVSKTALSIDETNQLVDRCRAEGATVHSAVCAAATQVTLGEGGRDFVRVLSPLSLGRLFDVTQDSAMYFAVGRTGFASGQSQDFWSLARATGAALAEVRSAEAILTTSAAISAMVPADATSETAEGLFLAAAPYEVEVSNLGVTDLGDEGAVRATALWGPITLNQLDQERVVGVTTFGGSLRMTLASHTAGTAFLDEVRRILVSS